MEVNSYFRSLSQILIGKGAKLRRKSCKVQCVNYCNVNFYFFFARDQIFCKINAQSFSYFRKTMTVDCLKTRVEIHCVAIQEKKSVRLKVNCVSRGDTNEFLHSAHVLRYEVQVLQNPFCHCLLHSCLYIYKNLKSIFFQVVF